MLELPEQARYRPVAVLTRNLLNERVFEDFNTPE